MAFKIGGNEFISDGTTANANVKYLSVSSLGYISVGNVTPTTPPHAGTLYGYIGGGAYPLRPTSIFIPDIYRFPFSSDSPTTDVANMAVQRRRCHVASSQLAGYAMGGDALTPGLPPSLGGSYYFNIEKFNFSSEAPATLVGSLQFVRTNSGGGCASPTHGYAGGGKIAGEFVVDIERFPFASESETATVGTLTYNRSGHQEAASVTHGYNMNGNFTGSGVPAPTTVSSTTIERYQFAAEAEGTVIGDSTIGRWLGSGLSSPTHAYAAGGVSNDPAIRYNRIDKVSFSSEGNATTVGALTSNVGSTTAVTSSTNGYVVGGATNVPPSPTITGTNAIDKFPFATDTNATDVADLSEIIYQAAGYIN